MINNFIDNFKRYIPAFVRKNLRTLIPFMEYDKHFRKLQNPYANEPDEILYKGCKFKVGIFKEFFQRFW